MFLLRILKWFHEKMYPTPTIDTALEKLIKQQRLDRQRNILQQYTMIEARLAGLQLQIKQLAARPD